MVTFSHVCLQIMCSESHLAVRINDTYILGEIHKAVEMSNTIAPLLSNKGYDIQIIKAMST